MFRPLTILLLAVPLVACNDGDGTSISINAASSDGNMLAGVDGNTGQVAIDLPGGVAGNIKLPKIKLDAGDVDLNGVKLFPGSTISGMNIDADDRAGDDGSKVRIAFESPATPSKVRDWFLEKLSREAGFTIAANGDNLVGTTDEKQPFRLDLTPDGTDRSKGTIVIGS